MLELGILIKLEMIKLCLQHCYIVVPMHIQATDFYLISSTVTALHLISFRLFNFTKYT